MAQYSGSACWIGGAALGIALVLVLAARLVWHERSLGQGWTHKDVHVPHPHKVH